MISNMLLARNRKHVPSVRSYDESLENAYNGRTRQHTSLALPGTFWPAHTEREVPMLLTANKSDRIRVYTRVYVNV